MHENAGNNATHRAPRIAKAVLFLVSCSLLVGGLEAFREMGAPGRECDKMGQALGCAAGEWVRREAVDGRKQFEYYVTDVKQGYLERHLDVTFRVGGPPPESAQRPEDWVEMGELGLREKVTRTGIEYVPGVRAARSYLALKSGERLQRFEGADYDLRPQDVRRVEDFLLDRLELTVRGETVWARWGSGTVKVAPWTLALYLTYSYTKRLLRRLRRGRLQRLIKEYPQTETGLRAKTELEAMDRR